MKLKLNDVTKSYGSNLALSGFTAIFTPGIWPLLGPNGSGKSTLMNIITDNLKADRGEITYVPDSGEEENALKMGVRFREKLGFMPQYLGLYPNFTVERFMWYMAALKDVKKDEAKKQIPEILAAVELYDVLRRRIGALSGGMKQRMAIRNYISKISFNKIVIIATHVVSDIEFIAHGIILLKKGVIADNAPPQELIKKISGQVWNITCDESEVQAMQQKYRVTNISCDDVPGKAVLRVLSAERPETAGAAPVAPGLEDYYLSVFGEGAEQ
jgi:ABC-2 type transport system ATP-binding protein